MIRSYIIIAWRNILRNKSFSLINVSGLSIGVACCLILALYIEDELSYDRHHKHGDNLYRVTSQIVGREKAYSSASPPIAMALQQEIPEVESAVRLITPLSGEPNLIRYEDKIFYEHDGFIADSTLFDVLTYEFVEGSPHKALADANSVVITDRMAKKLFGNSPAVNKVISVQGVVSGDLKITGVIRDNPKTYVHINFVASTHSSGGWAAYLNEARVSRQWAGQNFAPTLLKLTPGHNKDEVLRKMNQVLQKYGAEDLKSLGMNKILGLEPVKDIYLRSDLDRTPRIINLYVIASIAAFILLIACINFMNLTTARATKRAGEIGVRKVMGAFRSSLAGQILGESMVIVLVSIVFSLVLVQIILPFFNQLTGKYISFSTGNFLYFAMVLVAISVVTGLIAGSYPAFYLSSFQPAQVLKGKFNAGRSAGWLRRSLVVFQFMIAIALVCGTLIISRQFAYIQEKNLGFNADAKIVLPIRTATAEKNYNALQQALLKINTVEEVSGADFMPGSVIYSDGRFFTEGGDMNTAIRHATNSVDHRYIELLEIPIIAGRSFTNNHQMDSSKVIINRASAKQFGFAPEEMIGKNLYYERQNEKYTFEVIGVMEDFHQSSLKEAITPTFFQLKPARASSDYMIADVKASNFGETVSAISNVWQDLIGDTPFEYTFLDQNIQRQYDEDRKLSNVINIFTIMAMIISCLGLYGLSAYMAERRVKELGVRKVMGASVQQLVAMMSKEFVKLVLVALIIAVPLAWYVMDKWLQEFAYKIKIDPAVFLYAGAVALIIAVITVSFESVKVAISNPVNTLRNE